MRVLWVCNQCIPVIAKHLNMEIGNKEGWLSGLSYKLLAEKDNEFELAVCFPAGHELETFKEEYEVTAYGFYEDRNNPHVYDSSLETRFKDILDDFKPDVIHIFGTEYPHALAMCKAAEDKDRILVGIQGVCSEIAEHYLDGISDGKADSFTLRDWLKKDNLRAQKDKFKLRGENEIQIIEIAGNITGRTDFDKAYTTKHNPKAEYHFMNETLRVNFYEGEWDFDKCEKHSIFVCQADYPIKGFHILLEALPIIEEAYPDVKVYVAGQNIMGDSLKRRILIGSYGKLLKEIIQRNGLSANVFFLGSRNAEEMKELYLKANVCVLPSVIENSPNSLGEAMLLKMPAVASDVGGVRNLLEDNKEGFIYPPLDKDKLAQAIIKMFELNGSEEQKLMCEAAGKHARDTHDANANYERLKEIYRKVANL